MSHSLLSVVIIWSLLGYRLLSYVIDCGNSDQCQNTTINCLSNEDCFVSCNDIESCLGSTINCPLNGDCIIQCVGGNACRDIMINATLSRGNFNLQCEESTDHCRDMTIYGSILDTNTGNFNLSCDGKVRACANSEIYCPIYGDCNVECIGDTSCRWSQIIGPIDGDLNIDCNGIKSCFDGIFDGSEALRLSVTGCIEDESCMDLSIYCPPHINHSTNCFLQGNDNLGKDNAGGTKIYAMNGWKDIDIDYSGTFNIVHGGRMFCGNNYDISCEISSDDWLCINSDDYCNNVDATSNPTIYPTLTPTQSPTTKQPTLQLNIMDTTLKPTVDINVAEQIETTNMNETDITLIQKLGNNTEEMDNVPIYIVIGVAVFVIIITCIVCIKTIKKYTTFKPIGNDNKDASSQDTDTLFRIVNQHDAIPGSIDFIDDHQQSGMDPLDSSINHILPQISRSRGNSGYLSAPISEIQSINGTHNNRNRFSSDYIVRKISDGSVLHEVSPRRNKWEADLSPLASKKGSDNDQVLGIINNNTTTDESNELHVDVSAPLPPPTERENSADTDSELYRVISTKPTTNCTNQ